VRVDGFLPGKMVSRGGFQENNVLISLWNVDESHKNPVLSKFVKYISDMVNRDRTSIHARGAQLSANHHFWRLIVQPPNYLPPPYQNPREVSATIHPSLSWRLATRMPIIVTVSRLSHLKIFRHNRPSSWLR